MKLTEEDVVEIKQKLAEGKLTREEIAEEYNTEVTAIKRISAGRTWSHIDGPQPKRRAHKPTAQATVDQLLDRVLNKNEHVKTVSAELGIDWSTAYRLIRKAKKTTNLP